VIHVPSGFSGNLANAATVSSATPDPTPGNNTGGDTDTPNPQADLSATKDDGSGTFTAGTDVSYTITVNNSGPSDAQALLLSDALPAGTTFVSLTLPAGWTRTDATAVGANGTITATRPTLVAGAPAQVFTLVIHVGSGFVGHLTIAATCSSATPDPPPGNNNGSDTDTPSPQADLSATKNDSRALHAALPIFSYTITVNNSGPSDAQTLLLSDALPAG